MQHLKKLINFCIDSYSAKPIYYSPISGVEYYFDSDLVKDCLCICFNGSNEKQDWKTNFDFGFLRDGIVKAHSGYGKGYLSVKPILTKDVCDRYLAKKFERILITGHSSGGAIGVFAALDLANQGYEVELYSFGSPAVGNGMHARVCSQKFSYWRCFNKFDPVAYMPPACLGYRHFGTGMQLSWLWRSHYVKGYFKAIEKMLNKAFSF